MEAQRRHVVVLFADVVGFTTFSERFGEEAAFALVRDMTAVVDEASRAEGARIHNIVGDGVIVVFGAPVAEEDAALKACRAALACLTALEAVWSRIETRYGMRPAVRIGISAGNAVFGSVHSAGEGAATVLGDTVNVASRLQALAEPGTILLTEPARRLVEGRVDLTFAGEHPVRGRQAPERIYRLTRIRDGATRFEAAMDRGLTAFVGRRGELDTLLAELDRGGAGARVIDVVGEPGIGKSRLLHEFRLRAEAADALTLAGACSPEGREKPFHAFIDVGRGAFRIARDDDRATIEAKLDEGLKAVGLEGDEPVDLLVNLLGFEPSRGRLSGLDGVLVGLRTRSLMERIVSARARSAPLVLLIEDIHWIDSASRALIETLTDIAPPARLLLVHTRRPEASPPWTRRSNTRTLPLGALDPRETSHLVHARFGAIQVSDALVGLIAAKSDGNALFAEEIVSYLVERGVVSPQASGAAFDADAVAAATPETVQAIFASRVDRLPVDDVRLLQVAAAVGRRFDPRLVAAVAGQEERGAEAFAALAEHDLVRRDEISGEYEFKHALLRDTIYERLLSASRAVIHAAVAEEMERRGGNALLERAEQLAHHFAEADNAPKAFRYLAMAARKSLNVYVIPEAEAQFRKALKLRERRPDAATPLETAQVVVGLLETLMLKSEYREAGRVAETYMPTVREAGETRELVAASYYLTFSLVQQRRLQEGLAVAAEALAVAERLGDQRARAFARVSLLQCRTRLALDDGDEAARRRAEILEDSARLNENFLRNSAYFVVCWDCIYRGLLKEARAHATALDAVGRSNGDPRAIAFANWIFGWIQIIGGSPEQAIRYAEEAHRAAIAPLDRLQAQAILAIAAILSGRAQEGLNRIEGLNAEFARLGALYNVVEGPLGAALIGVGRLTEGVRKIERAIASWESVGDRTYAGFSRVLLAEIYIEIRAGGRRAPLRVIWRNLATVLAAKFRGRQRANALLDQAASNRQWSREGAAFARVEYDRGRLHELRGRRAEAAGCFYRARAISEAQGLDTMRERSEQGLARVA